MFPQLRLARVKRYTSWEIETFRGVFASLVEFPSKLSEDSKIAHGKSETHVLQFTKSSVSSVKAAQHKLKVLTDVTAPARQWIPKSAYWLLISRLAARALSTALPTALPREVVQNLSHLLALFQSPETVDAGLTIVLSQEAGEFVKR